MILNNDQKASLALVRAGLWEKEVLLASYGKFDLKEIYRLAQEQAVLGLVAAGFVHVTDVKFPKEEVLQFVGRTLQIEQQNKAMNAFIADLIKKLRKEDIYVILVKGQGIAQCYEKPLWRSSGDVDLLSDSDYQRASNILTGIASSVDEENPHNKHLAMGIDGWSVELHGTLRGLIKE